MNKLSYVGKSWMRKDGPDMIPICAPGARLTGLKIGDRITPDCLAVMISSSAGLARGCPAQAGKTAFLNRADRPRNLDAARKVRQALADSGDDGAVRLVAGRLLPDPAVVELPGPNAV